MNLTDRELVALFVAASDSVRFLLGGYDLAAANRGAAKLAGEIKTRRLALRERDMHGSADRFAAKRLGRRCISDRRALAAYDDRERKRYLACGKCPCGSGATDPGPHIASCPWSDPNYGDDGVPF